jgi:N-acetylmuramic acid 6-phosphate etherase
VGPEVITGSTRMKSGTAQKLVLNMLTTASMIRMGFVYTNLMIHVQMKNEKLRERGRHIIMSAAGVDYQQADLTLRQAKGDIKVAIIMLLRRVSRNEALLLLKKNNMNLRSALGRARDRS